MDRRMRLYAAVVLVVVAVPVTGLVAVSTLSGETGPPAGTVGQDAADRLASMDGFNATVTQRFVGPNSTGNATVRRSARPGTGMFRETPASGGRGGRLTVSNGSTQWIYDRQNNSVTIIPTNAAEPRYVRQGERIERLFARLNVSRAAIDERKQVSSSAPVIRLPVDRPRQQSTTEQTNTSTGNVTLVYNGTATVSGREAYILELGSQSPARTNARSFTNFSQRLYVDTEWFLPLRTEASYELNGDRFRTTRVLRNVSINPGLDDSLFSFTPPDNATVGSPLLELDTSVYRDRAALAANTTLPVPDPDLPESFSLDSARLTTGEVRSLNSTTGEVRSLSLTYTNDTAAFSVSVTARTDRFNATPNGTNRSLGQPLTVNGQNATYNRFGTTRVVQWSCAGYQYSVSGQGVPRGPVVRVAESVECRG